MTQKIMAGASNTPNAMVDVSNDGKGKSPTGTSDEDLWALLEARADRRDVEIESYSP
eukprot:CAMPEP_0184687898 /NCGR_PEP_ID=MMETSP0312-20130426/27888_1 /TAXON_ID=31354 /ORGANISM="Compsopogon coeruleus, Strain SAG 36.94" /LENGTH=56 /DNA_ID=CAMNT_0027144483 /DNA_START=40 /DNA_END=206 /DNA_ORIENTATION=-